MNRIGTLRILTPSVFVGAILASSLSLAHHALIAFDNSRTIEVSGVIEEVFWANPHIRIAVRTIYMQDASRPENLASPHLGYSVGRWEDGVLLVTTTDIDYSFLDDRGTPLSEAAEISEAFEMSGDETRLDWSATVVDPETFSESVALSMVHFEWRPEVQIRPYNCTLYQG